MQASDRLNVHVHAAYGVHVACGRPPFDIWKRACVAWLRQCALELFFVDGGQMLVALGSQKGRDRCGVAILCCAGLQSLRVAFVCYVVWLMVVPESREG